MKTILLYSGLFLSLAACKKDAPEVVSIRIQNLSPYTFKSVFVNTSGGQNTYDSLSIGQRSDYKTFTRAYRYAYIKVVSQGQELVWQPFDYVGEDPLESGHYTYVLDVVGNQGQKSLTILRVEKP